MSGWAQYITAFFQVEDWEQREYTLATRDKSNRRYHGNKKDQPRGLVDVARYSLREDTRALRLKSKLFELRAAYVNLLSLREISQIEDTTATKKTNREGWSFLLAGVARFELTNEGVKVPCLTAWRYPYKITLIILP